MRIRHAHGFTDPPNQVIEAEIEPSRRAIAAYIESVFPLLRVQPELLTFTPSQLPDWELQVNVHGFGPFGEIRRDASETPL